MILSASFGPRVKKLGIGAPKIPASFHGTLRPAAFDMSRYADVEWIPDAETTKIREQREQQLPRAYPKLNVLRSST